MAGSQDYAADPRNETAKVYLNGEIVARADAKVSIFDAGFSMGDGVWEGLRLHKGRLLFLEAHLDRLFNGARAIGLSIGLDRAQLAAALQRTLDANAMNDGVHVRLMVTRGVKTTVSQDPRNALGSPTLAIVAEYKTPSSKGQGLRLATVSVRCTPAAMFDMRLNSHSRLNLITALLEAIDKGADEALMLDPAGFELQRHQLLLRPRRRGVHFLGRLLLQWSHARPCDRSLPGKRRADPARRFHRRRGGGRG